ncbi:testis-specific gene 13 protein [Monodelphis domestica]|uniref:testis-specific gene 13 protein n=1 Tax=Monodelphis domestica TaxID=13616 RepID=UPI0024E241C2|nr:testis-specific gene 13 protein [Monodelphis domestica]
MEAKKDQQEDQSSKRSSKSKEKKVDVLVNDSDQITLKTKMVPAEKSGEKLPVKKESKKMKKKKTENRKKRKKQNILFPAETQADLESILEVPTKMGGKAAWRKANIKMKWMGGFVRHKREETKEDDIEEEPVVQRPCKGRICWRRANLKMQWMTMTRARKTLESKGKISIPKPPSKPPIEGKVSWRKANVKIRGALAWKRRESKSDEGEFRGDLGTSKFVLKNLPYYTVHPDLLQYYVPLKVKAWDKIFAEDQRIKRFMTYVTEYDQNKTLLIMTNNPPPGPVNWQGKDKPPCYFSKELLAKPEEEQKTTALLPLKPRKKKIKFEHKTPFPVVILKDSKPKREQWYRFATQNDFKPEAKFSKLHILRKQQQMYPELTFAPDFRSGRGQERQRKTFISWEPLTLSSLLEVKPTLTLPLPGKKPFRFGRAQQWFINTSSAAH